MEDTNRDEDTISTERMNELFEQLLDAEYFGDKRKIFAEMREGMDYHILGNISAALEIPIQGKSLQDDMEFIDYALRVSSQYETKRFGR